ncbi:AGAP000258-PA-like protein [Anopheles sinensis]|uniref:Hexosyltransferase n=1 Tax=Anopheles sinensis TaxID=74873 RepID=A0A084VLR0_ANOSI|nr:AGAP000258-PA-like protein [Anopheles sinensis]
MPCPGLKVSHVIFVIVILITIIFYSSLNGRHFILEPRRYTNHRKNDPNVLPNRTISPTAADKALLVAPLPALKREKSKGSAQGPASSASSSSSSSSVVPQKPQTAAPEPEGEKVIKTRDLYHSGHLPDAACVTNLCPNNGTDVTLLILVTSAPTHREQRLAIRQSWGHYGSRRDISIGFIVGQTNEARVEDQLAAESYMYSDLIRGNFIDSYRNLTLKTISLLEWTKLHCPNASFLLKTDDDMFINVPKLLQFMESHNSQRRTIFGRLAKKWKPIRNKKSKYYVSPEQYYPPVFPPFTTGPAYLITADIIGEMFEKSLSQTYLKLEDVYTTGIVAQLLNIHRVNVKEFLNRRIAFNQCNIKKAISIHMVKNNEQLDLWKKLIDISVTCT